MPELILERNERLRLRGLAHHLPVTVLLGEKGFTPAVIKEIDRSLDIHGLIKVHVPGDDREERAAFYKSVADELNCACIQAIGKMLVFWRAPKDIEAVKKEAEQKKRNLVLGTRVDPGAMGAGREKTKRAPRTPKKSVKTPNSNKGKKTVIVARKKHDHLTKKAALSK